VIIPRREQNLSAEGGHNIVPKEAPASNHTVSRKGHEFVSIVS